MSHSATKISETMFLLVLLTLPLYLIRFSIFGIPTNVLEILAILSIIFSFSTNDFGIIVSKKKMIPLAISILILLAGLLFSILWNDDWKTGFGILKSWFIIPLIFSSTSLFLSEKQKKTSLACLLLSFSFVSYIAVLYLLKNNLTYDFRLKAFYLSPNHLAMFIAPGILIASYFAYTNTMILKRYISVCLVLLISAVLYFSKSYGAWISIFSGLSFLFFAIVSDKKLLFKSIPILTIFFIALVSTQANNPKLTGIFNERSSASSRLMIWNSAIAIGIDNTFVGIGPGNFQNKYLEYQKYFPPYLEWAVPQPHNLYLAFWLHGGLLGIIGFLCIIWTWIRAYITNINKTTLAAVPAAIIIFYLIYGLIDTPVWKNDLAFLFWLSLFLSVDTD